MIVQLDIYKLEGLLQDAANLGATKALTDAGVLKPFISKSEAYRIYSRRLIDRWLAENLIEPEKDGAGNAKLRLSRVRLEVLARTSNRVSWFKHFRGDEFHK
ncbi:hypothetical protein [Pedobacter panaciterrae]